MSVRLGETNINCVHAFFATLGFESDGVAFTDLVNQTSGVNKDFLTGSSLDDEAETFGFIEELDGSCLHCTN